MLSVVGCAFFPRLDQGEQIQHLGKKRSSVVEEQIQLLDAGKKMLSGFKGVGGNEPSSSAWSGSSAACARLDA